MRSNTWDSPTALASDWREAGLRYHAYSVFVRKRFGRPVHRVSLDGGFTCPNVDGTVATGGCVFCDNRSFSLSRRLSLRNLRDQLEVGIARVARRYQTNRFFAYFQPGTNTYAPVERLETLFRAAIDHPLVVGLIVGTRPDCVPDEVLDLLEEPAGRTYVSVEYGMQTMHDRSLDWMNRGHHHHATCDAVRRSRGRGLDISLHIMLGLPGESHAEMMATAQEVARLRPDAVKLHNLYAVKGTPLALDVASGTVRLLGRVEYVNTLADFLERLPPDCVMERLMGEAPAEYLVAPLWCLDKQKVKAEIEAELLRRDCWQGRLYQGD